MGRRLNTYTYVDNAPTMKTDPLGLMGHAPGKGSYAPGTGPGMGVGQMATNAWNLFNSLSCEAKCNFTVGLVCGPLAAAATETGPGAAVAYVACRAQVWSACFAGCGSSCPAK